MRTRSLVKRLTLAATVLALVVLFLFASSTALAQTVGSTLAPVVVNVTVTSVIIALLSVLVGFVGQAISTGTFFGLFPEPPGWIPYVTLFGTFLVPFVQSIAAAPIANSVAWVNAFLAGFMALTGAVGGITAHQHISAPKITRQAAANDNGTEAKKAA